MAKKKLSPEQRIDMLKGFGKGFVELVKSNKAAGYAATSLAILMLGKAKVISCGVCGTLQGVATYIAISDTVEEAGDSGFFGIGGMGETIAKGGTATLIGALWGMECEGGRQKYSAVDNGKYGPSFAEAGYDLRKFTEEHKARPLPEGGVTPGGGVEVWWWPD